MAPRADPGVVRAAFVQVRAMEAADDSFKKIPAAVLAMRREPAYSELMSAIWDKAKASALKILGDSGKVPDLPDTVDKAADTLDKADDAFDKSREDCEAKLLAVQNGNDAVRNTLKQFLAKVAKSDFELDSKNKDDAKKIQKARQILTDTLNSAIKAYDSDDKVLDEVDKHLIQMSKYKPTPGAL
jgi:hypothetical protein